MSAWAAGVLDARGCITRCSDVPRASIDSQNHELVIRFANEVGVGRVLGPYTSKHRCQSMMWVAHGDEVMLVRNKLKAHLSESTKRRFQEVCCG